MRCNVSGGGGGGRAPISLRSGNYVPKRNTALSNSVFITAVPGTYMFSIIPFFLPSSLHVSGLPKLLMRSYSLRLLNRPTNQSTTNQPTDPRTSNESKDKSSQPIEINGYINQISQPINQSINQPTNRMHQPVDPRVNHVRVSPPRSRTVGRATPAAESWGTSTPQETTATEKGGGKGVGNRGRVNRKAGYTKRGRGILTANTIIIQETARRYKHTRQQRGSTPEGCTHPGRASTKWLNFTRLQTLTSGAYNVFQRTVDAQLVYETGSTVLAD